MSAVLVAFTCSTVAATFDEWTTSGPEGGRVWSILVSPADSSTVYAGTEGGIFKSSDEGETWNRLGLGPSNPYVVSLTVHPLAPDTLYAASLGGGGFFKSEDAGQTWRDIRGGLGSAFVLAHAFHTDDPLVLYAGTPDNGLFKTTDGGETWERPGATLPNRPRIRDVEIDPTNPSVIYIAAEPAIFEGDPSSAGVFKSTDAGESWRRIVNGLPPNPGAFALAIHPENPQTLYAGVALVSENSTVGAGVYVSVDGGSAWAPTGLTHYLVEGLRLDPADPRVLYAWRPFSSVEKSEDAGATWRELSQRVVGGNSLDIEPSTGTVYAGGDGVYRSRNGGDSWERYATGLVATEMTLVVTDPVNSGIAYASTDGQLSGSLFKTENAGNSWEPVGPAVFSLAVDPLEPSSLFAVRGRAGIQRSDDGGRVWQPAQAGLGDGEDFRALAISPDGDALYAGTVSGRIFRSADRGRSWLPSESLNTWISDLAIDPLVPATVYAAGSRGDFFRSEDSGATWIAAGSVPSSVFALVVAPVDPPVLFASLGGDLYRSHNRGEDWTRVDAPNTLAIEVDRHSPSTLYIAGRSGAFRSDDLGLTWKVVGRGLPPIIVWDLALDSALPERLYAATDGGGVFTIERRSVCVGDCNANDGVSVDEIVTLLSIALGSASSAMCADGLLTEKVDVSLIVQSIRNALEGCAPA